MKQGSEKGKTPSQEWMERLMPTGLTHATKSVAWVLGNRAYGKKMECHPSHERIAMESGVSKKNVKRHLRELEDAGWLEIKQRFNDLGRPFNYYTLRYPQHAERLPHSEVDALQSAMTGTQFAAV